MIDTVVLNASYEIKSSLLLNDLMFSCSFHIFLNNFFVPLFSCHGWTLTEGVGSKFLTLNRH